MKVYACIPTYNEAENIAAITAIIFVPLCTLVLAPGEGKSWQHTFVAVAAIVAIAFAGALTAVLIHRTGGSSGAVPLDDEPTRRPSMSTRVWLLLAPRRNAPLVEPGGPFTTI